MEAITQKYVAEHLKTAHQILHGEHPFEIRVISKDDAVLTGIFDDEKSLTFWINELDCDDIKSWYWSYNALKPEIPVTNKLERGFATGDSHYESRRFFYIDIDPEKAGDMATDEEVSAATATKDKLLAYLAENGFNPSMVMFTGNGYAIFIKTDCWSQGNPNYLVGRFLKLLSDKFSTKTVIVDTSVHNISRLVRIAGLPNRKGEPARVATVLSTANVAGLSVERMKDFLTSNGMNTEPVIRFYKNGEGAMGENFERDEFFGHVEEATGVEVIGESLSADNVLRHILSGCIFNDHCRTSSGKTVFLEYPNGDIEYDCKSDDCEGLRLKDVLAHLREIGEPYCGEVWKNNDVDLLAKWGVEDLEADAEAIPVPILSLHPTVSHDTKSVEAASPMAETPSPSPPYEIDLSEEDTPAFEPDSDPKMLSDVGNGARMAAMFGNVIRYCKDNGLWYIWTGRRWKEDHTMFVYKLAKRVVKSIRDEAYALTEEDVEDGDKSMRDSLLGWHAVSMKKERLTAMVWCALSEGNISVQAKDFDKNHDLLNFLNGTLDLNTMTFRKHRQLDLITKIIPYNLDPMATCPKWVKFVSDIMCGNSDDVDFLQRFGGYGMCGDISEQCFIILWGDGSNGKSTFVGTLRKIGGVYTAQATFDTFTDDKNKAIRNDLAALNGVRLVAASESEKGTKLSEAVIKHLTGGEEITCRFLNHEFFSYQPTYKIWLSTNHKPRIRGVDDGIWRRVRLVEFRAKFKKELGNLNEHLQDELMAEAPGIINWLLAGYLKWKRNGLPIPENVKKATANYRSEQDTLALFLEDACEVAPTLFTHSKSAYLAYKAWAEEQGERPMGSKNFKAAMEERGFKHDHKKVNAKTQRVFLGVRVIFDPEESPKWVEEVE